MIRLTFVLALITFIASLGLGFVYESTAPKIEEQKRVIDELARRTALPDAACGVFVRIIYTEAAGDSFVYYMGYRDADTTEFAGYVTKAAGRGYSSTIETVVGVDSTGRITGMKITHQQETPGLGSKIEEVKTTKSVLDAIKELAGKGEAPMVAVDMVDTTGTARCLEVTLKDRSLCGEIEGLVAGGDTSAVVDLAPKALGLSPEDSTVVFCSPPLAFGVAKGVMDKLRAQVTPWFLKQFIGKAKGGLLVTAEDTDQYIQAITGATISSVAVTESVREAMTTLEEAIGGFKEETP
ncbi:MAG: FMN-binding protein [Candidatus Eisenbacteria bacterium]